ncbi:hypothetical protein [Streptomyces galbus]|uniref:hypothetical protein n=1 Tax=Streptomyces galbus TaxID=33898 RepID=UPI0035E3EDE7
MQQAAGVLVAGRDVAFTVESLSTAGSGHRTRPSGPPEFTTEVATFSCVPVQPDAEDWADLAALLGPGALADIFSCPAAPPSGWEPVFSLAGRQMIWAGFRTP